MSNKIPYLITYISYSCVYNNKGTIDESLLEQFLLDEVSEYIINNSCSTKFESIYDVKKFWERYKGYNVWEAYCVKNNDWINITPSNEDILLNIYEMTRSFEMLEDDVSEKNILNLEYLEDSKDLEYLEDLEDSEDLENLKNLEDLEENLEIINIDDVYSSETNDSSDLFGENIEIDWNTIYIQEQEEQNRE